MSVQVAHVTGKVLLEQRHRWDLFLEEILEPQLPGWMNRTDMAARFKLPAFREMAPEEALRHTWNVDALEETVRAVVRRMQAEIPLEQVQVTLVPALSFRWFREFVLPEARWTNGFTNGPGRVMLAVPPEPELAHLASMLAHELNHASPLNPIYRSADGILLLGELLVFEGMAEYCSLRLYPDQRWWWRDCPPEVEARVWREMQPCLDRKDAAPLMIGEKERGIPTFAGYTVGYHAVRAYMAQHPETSMVNLFQVPAEDVLLAYGCDHR